MRNGLFRDCLHIFWRWRSMEKSTLTTKKGLAQMLKGGVIMDVVTPEQARIAEDAGAVRGDGAGARARRHPRAGRRGPHERPRDDRRHHGGGDHPGDGEVPHRPFRRGADPRSDRHRLHRRERSADPRRRGATTSTSTTSRCRSSAAAATWARRCAASARARR